ncbi:MAG: glycosyltransferase [Gaiellaceae bacterium]
MRIAYFTHSLVSCWNHGNAHFLRGVITELQERGHDVVVYEPRTAWSRRSLLQDHGEAPLAMFRDAFPHLRARFYDYETVDVDELGDGCDIVIVHEWNEPWLVGELGRARRRGGRFRLLFHDTHHRMATAPHEMERFDLSEYDGVLAYGRVIAELYTRHGQTAWTWHEAADTRVFTPLPAVEKRGDLVWVGNWGDGERTEELREFLLRPARKLRLRGSVFGVRYPASAARAVEKSGLRYRGWVANYRVPEIYAEHRATVHVPRRPYREVLPGIPTIRPFEALACGIPLVSAPWDDVEGLFTPGTDFLVAHDAREMREHLRLLVNDEDAARALSAHGLKTIRARHTCAHRVDELLAICKKLGVRELK